MGDEESTSQPIPGIEGPLDPEVKERLDLLNDRRWIGYVLGALSIASIVYALCSTMKAVGALPEPAAGKEVFAYVRMGTHAVVVVAWVWFSYQMLRAAERMILPYWWLRQNLDSVKLMLGISDPWRAALKASEEILEVTAKATQAAAKTVDTVAATMKKP
jgi:hypothetical protein